MPDMMLFEGRCIPVTEARAIIRERRRLIDELKGNPQPKPALAAPYITPPQRPLPNQNNRIRLRHLANELARLRREMVLPKAAETYLARAVRDLRKTCKILDRADGRE